VKNKKGTLSWRCSSGNNNMRAQVATEFFLYASVFIFVVIAAFLIVSYVQSVEIPSKEYQMTKETGELFANVVTLAVKGGEGFSYNFTFQRTVLGKPYTLYFEPNEKPWMIIEWSSGYGNFSYVYPIPTYNYIYKDCLCPSGGSCKASAAPRLVSDKCSGYLLLENNGKDIVLTQVK